MGHIRYMPKYSPLKLISTSEGLYQCVFPICLTIANLFHDLLPFFVCFPSAVLKLGEIRVLGRLPSHNLGEGRGQKKCMSQICNAGTNAVRNI